jgi:hypothetical protein
MNQVKRTARKRFLRQSLESGVKKTQFLPVRKTKASIKEFEFMTEPVLDELSDEAIAKRRILWGRRVGKVQPSPRKLTKKGIRRRRTDGPRWEYEG